MGACEELLEENCLTHGGDWQGAFTTCDPNPCPAVCCCYGQYLVCIIVPESECHLPMYSCWWYPEHGSCDPNPCPPFTASRHETWGRIKALYR